MSPEKTNIGVDIGGVIIGDKQKSTTDTSFFAENFPPVSGAFEALTNLNANGFEDRIYLVSKAGTNTQLKTLQWLDNHDFFRKTGIKPEFIRFCETRADKAGICEELGITYFLDDHMEVLSHLRSVPNLFIFKPRALDISKYPDMVSQVTVIENWPQFEQKLLAPR